MLRVFIGILIGLLCFANVLHAYEVVFQGIEDRETLKLVKSASELQALSHCSPGTSAALRRRADDDIPNILKALHSRAYFNAHVAIDFDFKDDATVVVVKVDTGPVYLLKEFLILVSEKNPDKKHPFPYDCIHLADLKITLQEPALPKKILDAEEELIKLMSRTGHPLAKVDKREVIADQATKLVSVFLHVDSGPLAHFGQVNIKGQCKVKEAFFYKKIRWKEGCIYDPKKVDKTLNILESSNLFKTITITHDEEADECNSLPMNIEVGESHHRSVAGGVSYNTDLGAGGMAEWEHRNIRGMGERLSLKANVWQIKQEIRCIYVKPDFICRDQDLIFQAETEHEKTKGYTESSMTVSGKVERRIGEIYQISYGIAYEWLKTSHSENNREFQLLKAPFQLLVTKTNNLLDPTWGRTDHLKVTPAYQTMSPNFAYIVNIYTTTAYAPIDREHRFVLAGKATVGTIWGATKHSIPPSERFYGGSDNLLRGYRYLTVSPLNHRRKPIGGRSLMVYSLELRVRATKCLGFVAFWDIGNAYSTTWPRFNHRQFQSTGLGFRYHTPIGPLRFDIAFPLDRRRKLDHFFQIYVSIGQAF